MCLKAARKLLGAAQANEIQCFQTSSFKPHHLIALNIESIQTYTHTHAQLNQTMMITLPDWVDYHLFAHLCQSQQRFPPINIICFLQAI